MAITVEQVMEVLGRSPAKNKANVDRVVAHYCGLANSQKKISDDTRIKQVITKVVGALVTEEDYADDKGSSMRSALNPQISYSLSGRNFSNNSRVSHRGRLSD